MKQPKVTIEELIEREGRWLGGVRPAFYDFADLAWRELLRAQGIPTKVHRYATRHGGLARFIRPTISAEEEQRYLAHCAALPPPGTRIYNILLQRGDEDCEKLKSAGFRPVKE